MLIPRHGVISYLILQTNNSYQSSVAFMRLVAHKLSLTLEFRVLGFVSVNSILDFVSEGSYQTLNWPGSGVTQSANGVTLNLVRELLKHVDFGEVSVAKLHALEHVDHPSCSLSARRALSTTFVLVELGEAQNSIDYIGLVIHNDNGSRAQI